MLTRNVSVYSMKVIPALILTAQLPNSSSLKPLPPLPSTTQRITRRYIAETIATVRMTSQTLAPNVTCATPATTINFRNGPKTYRGEVAGSPPPASAPSNEFLSLWETCAISAVPRKLFTMNTNALEDKWRILFCCAPLTACSSAGEHLTRALDRDGSNAGASHAAGILLWRVA